MSNANELSDALLKVITRPNPAPHPNDVTQIIGPIKTADGRTEAAKLDLTGLHKWMALAAGEIDRLETSVKGDMTHLLEEIS